MKYAPTLRKQFKEISLQVYDLLLLESFQIEYLPQRVPQKEFATLLKAYPLIQTFLIAKNHTIKRFIRSVLQNNFTPQDKNTIEEYCNELLWEIADLIIYNKYPHIYDEIVDFKWNINEIVDRNLLLGKTVVDVGAGSGKLSFLLAKYAKTVYAIEPSNSFRTYIREKGARENCKNIFPVDGFLNSIPFPENSFDLLFTSNAIGWDTENELKEIERVVKPVGMVIHIMKTSVGINENPAHDQLVSKKWNYRFYQENFDEIKKLKYTKTFSK